jgi:hypothetical protein
MFYDSLPRLAPVRRTVAVDMMKAADAWLASLSAEQRAMATRSRPDGDFERWFYTPTDHGGLALGTQRPAAQRLALRLIASGLSEAGYVTVATVMGLENVLDRLEGWAADWGRDRGRDPGAYWLRVFGTPGDPTWGWRFGGHHVSLNNLVIDGALVSTTPCFIGADPHSAPLLGGERLRPLGALEDLARRLVENLDGAKRERAVLLSRAPSDIIGGNRPHIDDGDEMLHMNDDRLWNGTIAEPRLRRVAEGIDERAEAGSAYTAADHRLLALTRSPKGVAGVELDAGQRVILRDLVDAYGSRAPAGVWAGPPDDAALDAIHFAWAGPITPGSGHYYRIQGPHLLIEYDNTQREANHVHTVWRDPDCDFGRDDLRRHREDAHVAR